MRKSHVRNGGVQDLHERTDGHDQGDNPGIEGARLRRRLQQEPRFKLRGTGAEDLLSDVKL
jgi:hypothetical protein